MGLGPVRNAVCCRVARTVSRAGEREQARAAGRQDAYAWNLLERDVLARNKQVRTVFPKEQRGELVRRKHLHDRQGGIVLRIADHPRGVHALFRQILHQEPPQRFVADARDQFHRMA